MSRDLHELQETVVDGGGEDDAGRLVNERLECARGSNVRVGLAVVKQEETLLEQHEVDVPPKTLLPAAQGRPGHDRTLGADAPGRQVRCHKLGQLGLLG